MHSSLLRITPFATALFLLYGAATCLGASTKDVIHKQFDNANEGSVLVSADRASITVTTWDKAVADVTITREVKASSDERAQEILDEDEIDIVLDGQDVVVRLEVPNESFWKRSARRNYQIDIKVPAGYAADMRTSGGSITVDGLKESVRVKSSGGSLTLINLAGGAEGETSGGTVRVDHCTGGIDVRTSGGGITALDTTGVVTLRTSGGSINAERIKGRLDARTSGGTVTIRQLDGPVIAKSSGGSVSAEFISAPTEECSLSTSGGSVTAILPGDAAFDLDASTSGGGVHTEFAVTGSVKGGTIESPVNGGGPKLKLRTSGGSIRVEKASR